MKARQGDRWLGIDVGASKLLACIVDGDLGVRQTHKAETRREDGPDRILERAAALARELIAGAGPVRGVGVGFAGLVDSAAGVVLSSIMLPGFDGLPLASRLGGALDLPVFVDNDATAAGWGEYRALGSPPGLNMLHLTVGTGIGGAIVLGGRLYRGALGIAAEFGNTTIDWRGPGCWCGSRGCLNTVASGSAIASAAGMRDVHAVATAARAGHAGARAAIENGARALGAGVANFVNIFNPDRVTLSGGVIELGDDYLGWVREEARRRAFREAMAHVVIERTVRGYEVGAFGAACLAREQAGAGTGGAA
jgi:glucokinase